MRKIKFRAWDKKLKFMLTIFDNTTSEDWFMPNVNKNFEVMQYIDKNDINNKEIYEGDILEEDEGYYFEVVWDNEYAKFRLQWRTKAFQFPEWNRGIKMKIIGNIYENPELLDMEEKKDESV